MTVSTDRRKWPRGVVGIRPHAMTTLHKRFPWACCKHCGLVNLRNAATRKALRVGCYRWSDEA